MRHAGAQELPVPIRVHTRVSCGFNLGTAKVLTTVLYPSGQTVQFEGKTNEEGKYENNWDIEDTNMVPGEALITVIVSKEGKTSSEMTKTFQIK